MNAPVRSFEGKPLPPIARPRRRRRFERWLPRLTIYLLVATVVGVLLFPQVAITVPSGYVGVLWKRFGGGTVLDPRKIRDEGLHFIYPWDRLFLYDLRLQSITENYNVTSSDGVSLTASVNIRFRLQRDGTPVCIRPRAEYVGILIKPGIGGLTREVISRYTAEQVYSTARQEIQDKIREHVLERSERADDGTRRRDIVPRPAQGPVHALRHAVVRHRAAGALVAAINRKSEQYYVVLEYEFRVERRRVGTQEDRGARHPRFPADRRRELPIPTCAGGASKRRFSSRSPRTKIVIVGSTARTACRSFSARRTRNRATNDNRPATNL